MNIDRSRLGALLLLFLGAPPVAGCGAGPAAGEPESLGEASQAVTLAGRDFGGAYGYVNNGTLAPNPATGGASCPTGYADTQVLGTYNVDWPVHFCSRQSQAGVDPLYDFGGMWGYVGGAVKNNPITNAASCPAGYTDQRILGTYNVDYDLHACYQPHVAGVPQGYVFGGMWGSVNGGAPAPNPATGSASCPVGTTDTKVLENVNVDWPVHFCFQPPAPPPAPPPLAAWTPMPGPWHAGAHLMLLTDGRVMGFGDQGNVESVLISALSPSPTGKYEQGLWAPLASMADSRLFFGSHVLPDGKVIVVGGEDGTGKGWGEVYDPTAGATGAWAPRFDAGADVNLGKTADTETALLPDGTVYIAWSGEIYNPVKKQIAAAAPYPNGGFDEAAFVLLPDQSFLTIPNNTGTAYRYVPSTGAFVAAGTIPAGGLFNGGEIGPGLLLPSGRVLWLGANGKTAIYTPPASPADPGTWAAGPVIPDGYNAGDAPAIVLRNGHVLFLANAGYLAGPTNIYEYDPATNLMSAGAFAFNDAAFIGRMLPLPTGQVLLSNGSAGYLYTPPAGGDAWAPTISAISPVSSGVYQLTGTLLHGVSEGAAYGDDVEMATNFPLVRFECGGTVTYGRTFGWAAAVVGRSTAQQTTQFAVPSRAAGSCSLVVVTNGIPSAPRAVTVTNGVLDLTPTYLSGIWAIPSSGQINGTLGVSALSCADQCSANASCTGFYAFTDRNLCQLYGPGADTTGRAGPWSNVEMYWKKPNPDPTLRYSAGITPLPNNGALGADRLYGYQAYQCAEMCDGRADCVGFYAFTDWDTCQLYGAGAFTSSTQGPWSNVEMYWKPR